MKLQLLLLILALTMCQITSAQKNMDYAGEEENFWGCEEEQTWENNEDNSLDGGWTQMDPRDAENDQEVQDALNFGIQELVKRAIASGEIPDSSYSLLRVASVQEQVVSGMNYRFDVTLSSTDGLGVIVTFDVYSVLWEGTQELTSYFIIGMASMEDNNNGGEEETSWGCEEEDNWENNQDDPFVGGWTLMNPEDAQDDQEVQDALNFGVEELVKRAIASGELPEGSYSLDEVASIEEQVVSGMNYRFDVSLLSTDGVDVKVTFEVYSQSWMGTQELTSYFIFAVGSAEEDSF